MFRLQHIDYLLFLLTLPVVAYFFYRRREWMLSVIESLGGEGAFRKLLRGFDEKKQVRRFGMLMAALVLLILGLANPQVSGQKKAMQQDGLSVVMVLDVSNSMKSEDVAPNRLERARSFFQELLNSLRGNWVGLVLFAGSADVAAPPSNDYKYTYNKLVGASTESVAVQGTALNGALRKAILALSDKPGAIVLVTDGENHNSSALELAKQLKEKGIYLMAFGVGTVAGAPIPDELSGYKKDKEGATVHSKLNIEVLKNLAQTTGGYAQVLIDNEKDVKLVNEKISLIESGAIETVDTTSYNSFFQFLLFPAFLLLLSELYWNRLSKN